MSRNMETYPQRHVVEAALSVIASDNAQTPEIETLWRVELHPNTKLGLYFPDEYTVISGKCIYYREGGVISRKTNTSTEFFFVDQAYRIEVETTNEVIP